MLRPQALLYDRQRPLVERLSFIVLALLVIQSRQVVEAVGHIGVRRSQGLLSDCQCPLIERLGLRVLALEPIEFR